MQLVYEVLRIHADIHGMSKGIFVEFRLVDVDLDDLRVPRVVFGVVTGLGNREPSRNSDIKIASLDSKVRTSLCESSRSPQV